LKVTYTVLTGDWARIDSIRIGIASQISKLNFDYAIVMLRFYKKIYAAAA